MFECDFVWRFLALGTFDQPYHTVEEGFPRIYANLHHDLVRHHARAPGDRRTVAAGFADNRRRFPGNGGFVDRRDALDHITVAGNDITNFDQHQRPAPTAPLPVQV